MARQPETFLESKGLGGGTNGETQVEWPKWVGQSKSERGMAANCELHEMNENGGRAGGEKNLVCGSVL